MTLELHSLSPLQLQVKGSSVLIALMVRCGFIELLCVDGEPAFFKLATGSAKPPIINHVFSSALSAPKRSRAVAVGLSAAHLPWGRTPEYTHTNTHTGLEILQAHWICRGGRGHARTGLSVSTTRHDFHNYSSQASGFS